MADIMTFYTVPKALMEALHSMGLPKHVIELHLHIVPGEPVTVDCKHYIEQPDGKILCDETKGELVALTKQYKLVEVPPEPREIPQGGFNPALHSPNCAAVLTMNLADDARLVCNCFCDKCGVLGAAHVLDCS